ncbi:hypothetical protein VE04_03627 [Pseudogymnoascus sp. 24MN13]|nr:hypothetical protein VE04_03627 [Pseudogymnoascus sp. 24MN13]
MGSRATQVDDQRLEGEKRLKFKGTAKISLDVLYFKQNQPRQLNLKHVEYLKECFQNEGCHRLPLCRHIPAKIDQWCLDATIKESGVSARQLLSTAKRAGGTTDYPRLIFPSDVQVECLHGRHRIEALKKSRLLPEDMWWTVDLYLSDLDADLETCLIEEYTKEEKPSDGELYYNIRQYHRQKNYSFKMRWMARLKGVRKKNMSYLLKHEELTDAFDSLLDIPGLWGGMMITTLNKVVATATPKQQHIKYLTHIKETWSSLVEDDKTAMGKIDHKTVKALELCAPWASTLDAEYLRSEVLEGRLFSAFSFPERIGIWNRLRMVDGLIPSLFTFFKDVRYLELCNNCVKRLVSVSPKQDVYRALRRKYTGVNQVGGHLKIQVTQNSFIYWPGTREKRIDMGCRGLNAFAMRNYPDIPREAVADDPVKKPIARADNAVLRRYADLATELGFVSPEITNLQQYPRSTATGVENPRSSPPLVTPGPGVARAKRCGIPRRRAYEEDRGSLFINHLHDGRQDQGEGITSFFVRRSVYFAFFGRPATTPANSHSTGGQGSRDSPGSSSPDSFQSESAIQSPLTTSDDVDLIMTYYAQTSQSGAIDIDHDGQNEDIISHSGETQALVVRGQSEQEQEQPGHDQLDQDQLENEQTQLEQARQLELRRERLEQQEQERQEQERQEQQQEQQQQEQEQNRLRQEQLKKGKLEKEQVERNKRRIDIKIRNGLSWANLATLYPTDSKEVETYVKKSMREGLRAFNTKLQLLGPVECHKAVIDDNTHTILLVASHRAIAINDEMLKSAAEIGKKAIERNSSLKPT